MVRCRRGPRAPRTPVVPLGTISRLICDVPGRERNKIRERGRKRGRKKERDSKSSRERREELTGKRIEREKGRPSKQEGRATDLLVMMGTFALHIHYKQTGTDRLLSDFFGKKDVSKDERDNEEPLHTFARITEHRLV